MRTGIAAFSVTILMAMAASAADVSDADHLVDVMNQRLESQGMGGQVPWLNPSTGNGGIVTILSTDDSDPENPCRSYRYTIVNPTAPTVVVEGNACRFGPLVWQRTEAQVSLAPDPAPAAPVARADPEPTEPPPDFPPPAHKPDPDVFYASIPTPSVY